MAGEKRTKTVIGRAALIGALAALALLIAVTIYWIVLNVHSWAVAQPRYSPASDFVGPMFYFLLYSLPVSLVGAIVGTVAGLIVRLVSSATRRLRARGTEP